MNIKSLVTFKTILEMGSFQKAADNFFFTVYAYVGSSVHNRLIDFPGLYGIDYKLHIRGFMFTFKTILEMGSFQKAADKLGYTQSTVTFQIKQLEL